MKGTLAPYFLDNVAILILSVETITSEKIFEDNASYIG